MKNKLNEPKLAAHIGHIISEILINIGSALAVVAFIIMIYHISNENYTFKGTLTNFEQSIFMMIRYGIALVLGGTISIISCACHINASKAEDVEIKICDSCYNSTEALICPECAKKSLSDDQNQQSDS